MSQSNLSVVLLSLPLLLSQPFKVVIIILSCSSLKHLRGGQAEGCLQDELITVSPHAVSQVVDVDLGRAIVPVTLEVSVHILSPLIRDASNSETFKLDVER